MADIICRWRNSTPKTVREFVEELPKEEMSSKEFRKRMRDSKYGNDFFHTPYQLACQLGLYYEDTAIDKYIPRFSRNITEEEAFDYLKLWISRYYIPNPYIKHSSFQEIEPKPFLWSLVSFLEENSGRYNIHDACEQVFKEEIGNKDIIVNALNNYSEVIKIDKNGMAELVDNYKDIMKHIINRNDKWAFYNAFNRNDVIADYDKESAETQETLFVENKAHRDFVFNVLKHFESIDKLNAIIPYASPANFGSSIKISKDGAFNLVGMFLESTIDDVKQRNSQQKRWFEDYFMLGDRSVYLSTQWYPESDRTDQLKLTDFYKMIQICYGENYVFRTGQNNEHQLWKTNGSVLPLQQIFYGAPGTGKSHEIKKQTKGECVFRTTFHPDSDYSTFVGCYKPTKENAVTQNQQSILDYDTLVDKFKEYLGVKDPYQNSTRACTLFGYDFHDSIVRMQENNTHTIPELVADAYKSGTTYDSQVRAGMACYEESVKPQISSSKITYSFVPQTFTKAYLRAWQTTEPVYLVIEEINRGNCAQIFGDLFQLLDRKCDGFSEYPIKADNDLATYIAEKLSASTRTDIPELVKSGEELVLPSNLYIWATMNTSDQSLFPIDSAFKRRWDWTYIPIDTTKESWNINADGVNYDWSDFLEKINAKIESATSSEDKMLGFYFCKAENDVITAERFVNKVIFYLWNDVFKDYGFDDAVFNDENNKKITFRMFYKADGKVDESMVKRFLENLGVKNDKTPKSETQE